MSISTNSQNKSAILDVTVQPKSSRSCIVYSENTIKVYINSAPIDGKANEECVALFSKLLKIAKSKIIIVKGEKGRKKRLHILGLSIPEIHEIFKKGFL
jgi:uncharacterized protein